MKHIMAIALLTSAVTMTATGDANARSSHGVHAPAYEGRTVRAHPQTPRTIQLCEEMCSQDTSPCDPIYFKTADGRCAGIPMGGH
jgi:hypothetical protein